MKVERWQIDRVRPYTANPRMIGARAVEAVAESIKRYGFQQPIVVDEDGVIIVGHTRWLAAKQLGLSEVPVHVAEGMSEEDARAYRIADNRVAQASEWDVEALMEELRSLEGEYTGFTIQAIEEIERSLEIQEEKGKKKDEEGAKPTKYCLVVPKGLAARLDEFRDGMTDEEAGAEILRILQGGRNADHAEV